jgi:tetratricopeptide (TPR) repeat protein
MTEQKRYEWKTRQLRVFVVSDNVFGLDVSPRYRVRKAGRAVNAAEANLSRLDPLLTDIRFRYVNALNLAGAGSKRLRDSLGQVIREASVVHGPDYWVVDRLRGIQREDRRIGGARALRKIERMLILADQLRKEGGIPYVFAVRDLADRYRKAGSHKLFVETIDNLISERNRLGLDSFEQHLFAQVVGAALLEAGEVQRALTPLEEARKKSRENFAANASGADLWELAYLELTTAQCQLAMGKAKAAEAVLRGALARMKSIDGDAGKSHARLRHRTEFELGTALFRQERYEEAVDRFQEATALLAASPNPPEGTFTTYRNTRIYATIVARDQAS